MSDKIKLTTDVRVGSTGVEVTNVLSIPNEVINKLYEDFANVDNFSYALETMGDIPSIYSIRDYLDGANLRDFRNPTCDYVLKKFMDATRGGGDWLDDDNGEAFEELLEKAKQILSDVSLEDRTKFVQGYINQNLPDPEYAIEHPCCCYGGEEVEDKICSYLEKLLFPEMNLPSLSDIRSALKEYIDDTAPRNVTQEALNAIVDACFAGTQGAVSMMHNSSDLGSWDPH